MVSIPALTRLSSSFVGDILRYYRLTFQETADLVILQRPDEL
jgi:hypothetical protein